MRIAVVLLLALVFATGAIAQDKDTRVVDPVCGMKIDKAQARATSEFRGETYYFCSPNCKELFDKDPITYIHKGSKFLAFDPVCMMRVDPKKAAGQSVYNKATYYFCNDRCKQLFDKEPAKYEKALKSKKYQDPVCKHKYPMSEVGAMQAYKGKQYFFCTTSCKEEFVEDPARHAGTG
jgi:YHS domain-containing protein